jgi:tetratricopeptide (TPR) repeat protein
MIFRNIIYLFFFSLIASNTLYAQTRQLDSLKNIVITSKVDTLKIKAAYEIGKKILGSKPDTAITYFTIALNLCEAKLKTQNSTIELTRIKFLKANVLFRIGIIEDNKSNYAEAEKLYKQSLALREEIKDKVGIAWSLNNLANIYYFQGQISQALDYHNRALKIREESKDKNGIAASLNNMAVIYETQGQISQAIDCHTRSLKIKEDIDEKSGIARSLGNLAVIYKNQGQISSALDYSYRSLKIYEEINDKIGVASSLNNLAIIFKNQGQFPQALDYYARSLKIREEIGEKSGIATVLSNMGILYTLQAKEIQNKDSSIYREQLRSQALDNFLRSLKISEELKNKDLITFVLNSMAMLKLNQNQDSSALLYGLRSLEVAKEIGYPEKILNASFTLHEVYMMQKNYSAALEMYKLYIQMRDSVSNEENQKKSLQNKMQYEFEKTTALQKASFDKTQDSLKLVNERRMALQSLDFEYAQKQAQAKTEEERKQLLFEEELKRNQIESDFKQKQVALNAEQERKEVLAKAEQEKKDALTQKEKEKQRLILFSVIAGLFLVAVFAVFMYKRFKTTQQQKQIIELKEKETQQQKHLIEEKQKEILDSIHYAKRLQDAILPPLAFINEYVPNNFVLYQPKDVVAGDFYWAETKDNKFFIAAADCTGHGVPGAMVSVVCSNALNRTVNEFGVTDTGKILDKTRELVLETFAKGNAEVKDGMDISILCIDKQNNKVFWSGANNPLWYVCSSKENEKHPELFEVKADKQPIGKSDHNKPFTTNEIDLQKDMLFYLFTDGFADQFGGPKGKKFKYKQLEELLISIAHESMENQKQILSNTLNNWKGNLEQVDDVCVIGVRI